MNSLFFLLALLFAISQASPTAPSQASPADPSQASPTAPSQVASAPPRPLLVKQNGTVGADTKTAADALAAHVKSVVRHGDQHGTMGWYDRMMHGN
jgi:hypothetical protein